MNKLYWLVYENGEMWVDGVHKRGSDLLYQWAEDAIKESLGELKDTTGYLEIKDNNCKFTESRNWIAW